jgi:hypothetical protein
MREKPGPNCGIGQALSSNPDGWARVPLILVSHIDWGVITAVI